MISNLLQKPLGAVAVLTAAIGGPYAAFETEFGNTIRRSIVANTTSNSASPSNAGSMGGTSLQNDSYSLIAAANSGQSSSSNSNWGGQGNWSSQGTNVPFQQNSISPNGQLVSTSYGPATIIPLPQGTPMQPMGNVPYQPGASFQPGTTYQPGPIIENRSGPSNVISGNTNQLWDYTLGTPTLPQMQQQQQASVGGGVIPDLREVLRFDITPGWLPQRFARVTTVTSNVQMDGLRVPLITGTQPGDIAGSLTYYFDAAKSLRRIHLHGMTGDPSSLANLMVQYYHLQPEQSLGGQLFTARWNNRITSILQVAPAPVIYAGADHSKYILFLELNQPSNQYGLSDEASEILKNSQATQRWQ